MSLSRFFAVVGLVIAGHGAGCGPMDNPPITKDLASRDFNIILEDLAGEGLDLSAPADLSSSSGCIKLATWPKNLPVAYYDPADNVTAAGYADGVAMPFKALTLEDWHLSPSATYPKSHTFSSTDDYATCDLCSLILDCTAAAGCEARFFAQAGTVTVTRADSNELVGRMTATASNLKLIEWDADNDVPVPNGTCYEVASMSWDIPWDDRPDMGAPDLKGVDLAGVDLAGVDLSMPVIDMAPPDLEGVDFGTCHPVINEVLTGLLGSGSADAEFIEIYNPCATSFNTTGWTLEYRSNTGTADLEVATLPPSVAPGEYLLFVSDEYANQSSAADAGVAATSRTTQNLAGGGGGLGLRTNTNAIIDRVAWGSATNIYRETLSAVAPTAAAFPGTSIARKTVSPIDTNHNRNDFVAEPAPTPGAANH